MNTSSLFARRLVRPAVLALAVGATALLPTTLVPPAQAQAPVPPPPPVTAGDAKEFDAADALFAQGKFQDAMVAFEAFRNKYGNKSPKSLDAKYRLGICYLQVKSYDDAAREFRQLLVDPKLPKESKEGIQLLIAKAITLKGVALPSGTLVQKGAQNKAFEEAIGEYDKYLAEYPKAKSSDTAHFLRATLLMAIESYDESVKGFASVITGFPQSPMRWPSQLNIGKARMNQAYGPLTPKDGKEPKPEEVTASLAIFRTQALPALEDTYRGSGDLALMNEAVYYIGQIRLTLHQNEPPSEDPVEKKKQDLLLLSALDAFRAVRSREEVVAAQEQKIEGYRTQLKLLNPADVANYTPSKNYLESLIEIEEGKKAKFLDEQDQFLGARLAIAQIFRTQKKFDECRVLVRYLKGQKEALEKDKDAQASLANILAMTYIEQKNIPKGTEACEAFRTEFKGNAAGEALPLALAALLVENPTAQSVAKAEEVLKQAREDYKPWRYESQSIQVEVGIYIGNEKYDEAIGKVKEALAQNPKPEVEVDLLMTEAGILRAMATKKNAPEKADEAVGIYRIIREKSSSNPKSEDAWFEMASVIEGRNPPAALTEFKQFIEKFKGGSGKSDNTAKNVPLSQFHIGRLLQGMGKLDDAVKAYRELWEKWPDAEPTPNSYFKVYEILAERKDFPAAAKVMEDYLQKYPKHEYTYYAYSNLAELLFTASLKAKKGQSPPQPTDADLEAGTKKLMEYVELELSKGPDVQDPQGPKTLLKISDKWKRAIPAGLYFTLNGAQKLIWQKAIENVVTPNERILKSYLNKSEDVLKALSNLVFAQKELVKAKINQVAQGEAFFTKLTDQYGADPGVKSKILFAYADFLQDFDKAKADKLRDDAIKTAGATKTIAEKPAPGAAPGTSPEPPAPSFTPDQYDTYLAGQFDKKAYDEMTKRIATMRAEYSLKKDELPERAPKFVQDAQAVALFWEGKILIAQGKETDGGAKFEELKKLYPNSNKVLEADYGVILGKLAMTPPQLEDNFMERLKVIVNKTETKTKGFELPAKALFLSGRVLEAQNRYDDAIVTYKNVAFAYKSVPAVASESLWRASDILKKQFNGQIPVKTKGELIEEMKARKALADKKAKEDAGKKTLNDADKKKAGGDKAKDEAKPGETKGETKAGEPAKAQPGKPEPAKPEEKNAAKPDAVQK